MSTLCTDTRIRVNENIVSRGPLRKPRVWSTPGWPNMSRYRGSFETTEYSCFQSDAELMRRCSCSSSSSTCARSQLRVVPCESSVISTGGKGSGHQEAMRTRRYTCAPWRPRGACGACGCAGGARARAPRRARARAAGCAPRSTATRPPCPYLRAHANIFKYGLEECSSLLRLFFIHRALTFFQVEYIYSYALWSSSSSTNCWLSSSMCCSSLHVVR